MEQTVDYPAPRVPEQPVDGSLLESAATLAADEAQWMLKEALTACGINQTALAERLGQTRSGVAQMLTRYDVNPTVRTLAIWLRAMGYDLVIGFTPTASEETS